MRNAGRLVTVCLAKSPSTMESLLRIDAKPFIATHLKTLFAHRPQHFHSVRLHLAELFNTRCGNVSGRCARAPLSFTPNLLNILRSVPMLSQYATGKV